MSTCKACGSAFRKGVIATFVEPGMGPRGAKVCGECAKDGMLVVVRKIGPRVEQKVARPEGYERVLRMLRTYASAARASAVTYAAGGSLTSGNVFLRGVFSGKGEGLDVAIQTIVREMGGGS
jgi:hypothetical protein